ncbi:MAG: cytochrome c [Gammaproteobacteria bacterium]|nr:cytochrome c [Gammaproteobacteria bacterium]
MSMFNRWLITLLYLTAGTTLQAGEGPSLGTPLSAGEVAAADITVMPDGEGLPTGSGTAKTGTSVYLANCMACHGEKGTGGINDTLVGGHGSLTSDRPQKTIGSFWPYATTLFDYVRRAMPYQTPGSLANDEIYAVTAYLLYLNDIIDQDKELNAETLPEVKMPNHDNFVWAYSP